MGQLYMLFCKEKELLVVESREKSLIVSLLEGNQAAEPLSRWLAKTLK